MIKKKICLTLGTRPEIIRLATTINVFRRDKSIDFKLLYTGQHYDYEMKEVFFKEFGIKPPDIDLMIGSGSHAQQTSRIMIATEKFLMNYKADMVVVFGDTNSSLGVALASVKLKIPLTHIEAGGRENEMDIPEEINRRIIDHCSNLLISPSEVFVNNLKKENVMGDCYNLGDSMFEVFVNASKNSSPDRILKTYSLGKESYIFLTLHRDKNVDDISVLKEIIDGILSANIRVVFPVHPRTQDKLKKLGYTKEQTKNIVFLDPLGYHDTISLVKHSLMVITDSGGLQKEAFWSSVPCLTLRDHTSWVETVEIGANFLTKRISVIILKKIKYVVNNRDKIISSIKQSKNPYYKKNISKNTVKLVKKYAGKGWGA